MTWWVGHGGSKLLRWLVDLVCVGRAGEGGGVGHCMTEERGWEGHGHNGSWLWGSEQ